jgi:hypothetical protein
MPLFSPSIYRHEQTTPASVWTIVHNLGNNGSQGIPMVDAAIDLGGTLTKVIPSKTEMIDKNTVELTFTVAQSGFAMVIV